MGKLQKEFIVNVSAVSFILSAIYSFVWIKADYYFLSHETDINGDFGFAVFFIFFASLYVIHVLMCAIHYAAFRIGGTRARAATKFILFNGAGGLLIGGICYLTGSAVPLSLVCSLVVISIISGLHRTWSPS
ncbi:hypothetical protein [Paenibacillus sp. Leaf72]|uniref:hypothetical protein n=1 Tax=Paenibacillus sp. Leaf72 TaxID=1736234 RepID=UPI0006F97AF7|nr:hypothetical protein [Paenibacillus sp. Leaf72]KQO10635.1 hypothetical protein ASF12_09530 [Paenibacillus sp. Leaf72]